MHGSNSECKGCRGLNGRSFTASNCEQVILVNVALGLGNELLWYQVVTCAG
jgi:hypothetical protein